MIALNLLPIKYIEKIVQMIIFHRNYLALELILVDFVQLDHQGSRCLAIIRIMA